MIGRGVSSGCLSRLSAIPRHAAHRPALRIASPRPLALLALALLAALLGVLARPSPASAHGALRHSQPSAGAHLSAAPRELRLVFNEAVELAVARLRLIGPDSVVVPLSPLRRGDSASVIVADVAGPLVAGTYTVAWQIAGRDGHPVRDTFRFTIAPGATGLGAVADTVAARDSTIAGEEGPPAEGHHDPVAMPTGGAFDAESPLFAAVRWLGFAATLALTGVLGFGLAVLPAARGRGLTTGQSATDPWGRLRGFGLAAGVTLLAAAGLRLLAQSVAMHGPADAFDAGLVLAMLGTTLWGTAWFVQLAAALLALAGFALLLRRPAAGWTLAGVATVAAAVSASLSGHAAAVPGGAALAVLADAAHVLAAGGWLGTLLVLAAVGLPLALRQAPAERGRAAAALVDAFSPLALGCAAVVALTGVVSAWLHLGGLGALVGSGYGRTLLIKLAALLPVAAIGAYNWRRVRPTLADGSGAHRMRRSAAAELALGVVVLAVTAVLVATPTPLDGMN